MGQRLEFVRRNAAKKKEEEAGEKKDETTGEAAKDAAEAEAGEGDGIEGSTFQPTVYEFDGVDHPPFHKAYAGLSHQILEEVCTTAIHDDYEYWVGKGRNSKAGKLLLVDVLHLCLS